VAALEYSAARELLVYVTCLEIRGEIFVRDVDGYRDTDCCSQEEYLSRSFQWPVSRVRRL